MSALLDEIIATRKAKAIEYEDFLKRIAELAKQVQVGKGDDTPERLDTPGKRALYNSLKGVKPDYTAEPAGEYAVSGDSLLDLALTIDTTVKQVRPDGWRGVLAREQVIKAALYGVLQNGDAVERIFKIIFEHKGEY
jgi:type I restriction enzyme R subunit